MTRNYFKTADITISTDSVGAMTAEHRYQGLLIDSCYFGSRSECRKAAVIALADKKAGNVETDKQPEFGQYPFKG